jgi:hypothetical protein
MKKQVSKNNQQLGFKRRRWASRRSHRRVMEAVMEVEAAMAVAGQADGGWNNAWTLVG